MFKKDTCWMNKKKKKKKADKNHIDSSRKEKINTSNILLSYSPLTPHKKKRKWTDPQIFITKSNILLLLVGRIWT